MKRILNIGIILSIVFLIFFTNKSIYATTENSNTPSAKKEIVIDNVGENQIQVTVKLNELTNIGEGVNAYTGILEYNSDELEFVEFINVNNWNNPTYKILDNEIKVVSTSNEFLKEDNIIFKAIFNKKVNKNAYDVQMSKLELAAKINNETLKVDVNTENIKDIETVNNSMKIVMSMIVVAVIILLVIFIIYKKNKGGK